jgi:hypothetical protein
MSIKTAEEILAYFENWELDEESRIYIYVHHRRYEFLLKTVKKFLQNIQPIRILDIGGSFQTEIMRQNLKAIVNTLGFEDLRFQPRSGEKHFHFDLNDSQYIERWPVIEGHHLIVMAEVIEHLYTSPKLVLACATTWLKKGGYLIIQTPNAVSLRKRIIMLRGRNPYEMIRETRIHSGHFREYTIEELISVGKEIGLVCVDYSISNYFMDVSIRQGKSKWRMLKRLLYDTLYNILPNTFRDGITLCFQKKQTKLFMILGDHWHEFEQWQETPVRWISNNATLLSIPQKENISTLSLQILSFYKPRTLQVYLNDQLIHEQNIPTRFVEVEIPVKLKEGENILRFYTPDGCKKPVDIPELKNKDSRCLSLAFQNITID